MNQRFNFVNSLSEYFFTLLPFLVLTITFLYRGDLLRIIYLSEWSFASAILNGQAMIKFVKELVGLANRKQAKVPPELLAISMSGFVVLLIVPSLVLLVLVVLDDGRSFTLAASSIVFFLISSIIFLFLGSLLDKVEELIEKRDQK